MNIQINNSQGIYRKMELSKKRNNNHSQIMLNEIGGSSNSSNFAKVQKGLSTYDAYSLM